MLPRILGLPRPCGKPCAYRSVVSGQFSGPGRDGDMEALVFFIAEKSSNERFQAPRVHPRAQAAVAIGDAMFYSRSEPMDFSCQTCHHVDGARIPMQKRPMFDRPAEGGKIQVPSIKR